MTRKVTSYRLPEMTLNQIKSLTESTGSSDANVIAFAIDRMYQQEIKTMNTLKVETAIERSLGKAGGTGNERFEVRFWLSTEVNGRKVDSRGTVVTVEKPTVADARAWSRQITSTISSKIFNNQWSAKDAKEVNVALPGLVSDAIAEDAEFHTAFDGFAE